MYFIFSTILIENTKFIDNISDRINHGVTVVSSSVTASRILVDYTNDDFLYDNAYLVDSGFFLIQLQSSLTLTDNSIIQNCRGGIGSALYAAGSSNLTVSGDTIF